jgi:anti-sigma B factor antagonist
VNLEPICAVRSGWLGDRRLITLSGDIDIETATLFDDAVSRIPPGEQVYVDCSDVKFIDSHGLDVMLIANERLRARHGALHLIELSPATTRILQLCRMDASLRPQHHTTDRRAN